MTNQLYYGDNLALLREHVDDVTIDLIYLDPPFNSNASYNILFKSPAGGGTDANIEAFGDTWEWGPSASSALMDITQSGNHKLHTLMQAMKTAIGENAMMAYLAMMAVRLVELHRVLKPTGSLYLHCDPTASHYLKLVLDAVFGAENYRTEISWRRQSAHNDAAQGRKQFGNVRDIIFFYTKSKDWTFNWQYTPYDESYVRSFYRHVEDTTGRKYRLGDITAPGGSNPAKRNPHYEFLGVTRYWRYSKERMQQLYDDGRIIQTAPGRVPQYKRYLDEMPGVALQNDWTDINPLHGAEQERLGYPTQKPIALLERIIAASSNPGDVVLDPFCGCGTTVDAAQKLGRQWIGMDITVLAIDEIVDRLKRGYGDAAQFEVIGLPADLQSAQRLAATRPHDFQNWICRRLGGHPWEGGKKGGDKGVDGYFYYLGDDGAVETGVISVKAGANINPSMVRDLGRVMARDGHRLGIFACAANPTTGMEKEAASHGLVEIVTAGTTDQTATRFPALQIFTLAELFQNRRPNLPPIVSGSRRAGRVETRASHKPGAQGALL